MKKICSIVLCLGLFSLSAGCQNTQTHATEGAIIGGLLGATAGGIVGHQSGHGGEGAAIGLAAGALTGALVGGQMNKGQQPAQGQQAGQGTSANQMSVQQIVDLTKQGANEAVIIDKIHLSNSRFTLTPGDITYLQQQGVSQNVINAMQGG